MKNKFLIVVVLAALLIPGYRARAADPGTAAADLKDLVNRITASLQEGKRTEADQADHVKEFDALIAKYKGQTNDDVAEIALIKAGLYATIFKKPDHATEMLQQLELDFPGTITAKKAEQMIASIKEGEEARKIEALAAAAPEPNAMPLGSTFPDFDVKDLDGKPLSLAGYKGKVVMVDFWATWCPPCRAEVPNVAETYQKYHDKGFEIVGVSLDQEGDKDKLISFTKENNMPWRQYFDGKNWNNDLAVKYGIHSIPSAFLLDGSGKIIAEGDGIRGENLEPAVARALGIKFQGFLAEDTVFPDFDVKDLDDKPLSLAGYKGKVVMVDFSATWCPPCRAEVPNVVQTYQKYHAKGFEIVGVSLDREGDKDKLISFTKENNMPWRQYFDGKFWNNDLAVKYRIHGIPAAFLLDGNGKIIAAGEALRGGTLEPAVKKALGGN